MHKLHPILLPSLAALALFSSCANPHFFPRTRPLFVGFDDQHVSNKVREALYHAKVDFQLARSGKTPFYAQYVRKLPNSMSKVYQGEGYEITIIDETSFSGHSLGPKIIISSDITGGAPFKYEEVDDITG